MGASPQVADWDEDGDFDLIVGDGYGEVHYYENVGSTTAPELTDRGLLQDGASPIDVGYLANPVINDWDEDGRKDLVIGSDDLTILVYLNTGTNEAPTFDGYTTIDTDFTITEIKIALDIGDLNGDGLKDIAFGHWQGTVVYYPNTGTNAAPEFAEAYELTANGQTIDPGGWTHAELDDWDEDGNLDLLFGEWDGEVYYYRNTSGHAPRLVCGPGPAPDNPTNVRVFAAADNGDLLFVFPAYGTPAYGVNVATGDVTGDAISDILTGPGPGAVYGPHVRGFSINGTPLPQLSFFAYGTNKFGVNVTGGDIDGDGFDEIITGAGPGAVFGPHVRAFDYDGTPGVDPVPGVSYFAYGTPKWGVNVTAGDLDGDGFDEIVTGPGPGAVYGPHVRGWNVDGGVLIPMAGVSFLAYGTNKFGVMVGSGDVDGDGMAEIVTGAGPGSVFGAHVRGWNCDGGAVTALPGFDFFAWDAGTARYGVKVWAGTDLDGDGRADLAVGAGPDPAVSGGPVNTYRYLGGQVEPWFSLEAYPGKTHGTCVAAGIF